MDKNETYQWYHVIKEVQGRVSAETYLKFPEDWDCEDIIKGEVCFWAERVNYDGMSWAGFEYSWKKVDKPPNKWLTDQIIEEEELIRNSKNRITLYKLLL